MKGKQINFFATKSDLSSIIEFVEKNKSIHCYQMGLLDNSNIPEYDSIFKIPNLGHTSKGDWNQIESYLVVPNENDIKIRKVPQRSGGIKYAIDQKVNHDSVEVKPGGIFKEKILIAGRIATISDTFFSLDVLKLFSLVIAKTFTKIGSFYVGKEAEQKLRSGWRLVTNDKLPKEFDIALI